jgi:hypothetical protein
LLYRSLAITQQGHLVAVSESTQPGDIAVVLYGASVVCILRLQESALDTDHLVSHTSVKETPKKLIEYEVGEGNRAMNMTRKEYNLVGEAYLHGCMDAEGIAMCVREQLKESDFYLRQRLDNSFAQTIKDWMRVRYS